MTPLKRKVSCTFKRETPLEVQERIYQLAGQKRAAGNSNHWNVKELENLSQCSHFSHFGD